VAISGDSVGKVDVLDSGVRRLISQNTTKIRDHDLNSFRERLGDWSDGGFVFKLIPFEYYQHRLKASLLKCSEGIKRVFASKRGLPLLHGLTICAVRAVTYERDLDLKIHKSFLHRQVV